MPQSASTSPSSTSSESTANTAFITGATAGIGLATARLFAQKGWFVGLAARNAAKLEELQQELGPACCSCHVVDVVDADQVSQALQTFGEYTGGKLHLLVNNAGVLSAGHFEEISLQHHHAIIDTNIKGVINCMQAAFPLLKNTADAHVINMSSASAMYGSPALASYSASKFAVRALTEALSVEWARHGIAVSDIMPPFVATDMLDNPVRDKIKAISLLGVQLSAEDVAQSVWNSWNTRPLHDRVTKSFKVLALMQKYAPDLVQRRLVKLLSGY
ncbi:MAG TPA: SDR family oxidoreductase [Dongiaceae bacterium]|nr:SDR family oxidoreductase [Dongiaceae bacterium]